MLSLDVFVNALSCLRIREVTIERDLTDRAKNCSMHMTRHGAPYRHLEGR